MKTVLGRAIDRKIHLIETDDTHIENNLITVNKTIHFLKNNSFFIFDNMAKEIVILPKQFFNELLIRKNINDSNVNEYNKTAFISINDSQFSESFFKEKHPNVLRLYFDDIIRPLDFHKLFSQEDSDKIIEFSKINKDSQFIIHCEAGISRSGAVGQFINDIYKKMTLENFKKLNPHISPNYYVYYFLIRDYEKKLIK